MGCLFFIAVNDSNINIFLVSGWLLHEAQSAPSTEISRDSIQQCALDERIKYLIGSVQLSQEYLPVSSSRLLASRVEWLRRRVHRSSSLIPYV